MTWRSAEDRVVFILDGKENIHMTHDPQPLTELLAGNRMSLSETIRYALNIGGALRRIHADGRCHGALTPELIQVSESSARLLPATPGALEDLTPYTAPEILQGESPDARTDIFAFGAVLYEMATGRHAFLADNPEALEEEIMAKGFSPIGHEGLDQVVKQCLEKDPAARWQRMQQVQMELKLLGIAERQSDPGVLARHQELEAAVRAELEGQASLLADLERAVTARTNELAQAFTTALDDVQLQFAEVEKCLEASQQRADQFAQSAVQASESTQREIAVLQMGLAGEVHAIEQAAEGQAHTIESIKASVARNEDYVERVVEALEALQTLILEHPDRHEHQTVAVALAS
ncbi:MAG: protein kinase [Bryobacteraceae bacterium]